jgi:hypothetical protein
VFLLHTPQSSRFNAKIELESDEAGRRFLAGYPDFLHLLRPFFLASAKISFEVYLEREVLLEAKKREEKTVT